MKWKRAFAILVALLVALCILFAILLWRQLSAGKASDTEQSVADKVAEAYAAAPAQTTQTAEPEETTGSETEPEQTEESEPAESAEPEQQMEESDAEGTLYESPVDFDSLQAENSDIYAWLYIPNSEINYPILQSATDDTYYLDHDSEKTENYLGAIFTEHAYTSTDFTDPVTVVYGHKMRVKDMFGQLQEMYSAENSLDTYSVIMVYLPDRELQFEVFAAVPYDNRHILYTYDFTDEKTFQSFFDDILSVREIGAVFSENISLKTEDQVLILSTCLAGDSTKRYLVCAKLVSATDAFGTVLYN